MVTLNGLTGPTKFPTMRHKLNILPPNGQVKELNVEFVCLAVSQSAAPIHICLPVYVCTNHGETHGIMVLCRTWSRDLPTL